MAAATKLLQLRPKRTLPTTTTTTIPPTSTHFLSFSTTTTTTTTTTPSPDPNNNSSSSSSQPNPPPPPPTTPPPQSQSQSPFASYFSDVRASLKQQQQRNLQSPTPRKTSSFGSFNPNQHNPPSKIESLEEIRRNLSEFRRRSAAPPPPLPPSSPSNATNPPPHSPPKPISFQELYHQKAASKSEGSTSDASKLSFEAIRNSIRQLASSSPVKNKNEGSGRMINPSLFSKFKDSLGPRQVEPQRVIGGSDHLPSIFRPELEQKEKGNATDSKSRMEFLRTYGLTELGEKLRALRPEKRDKKDWFSLEELSERLVKLREMEEKENDSRLPGITFRDLRQSLAKLKEDDEEKARKNTLNRFDILRKIGETPGYMLSPPKDELVEKYFHPDNMSASEKMKLELKKVRDEFKMSESDCGSARLQVAQLTTKIKHLSDVLHKKDKHSRKGLEAMVQRRKKLLKYLRRTDWDSYCYVLSKLGLRDNPDYKEKKKREMKRT